MLWVFFVFLSYQDRNVVKGKLLNDSRGAENESKDAWFTVNRTLCAKMSVLAGGMEALYQVSDGRRTVRSVVDTRGDLVDCSVIVDRVQVRSFLHLCRLGLTQQDFHSKRLSAQNNRFVRMEEAMATCRQFTQRSEPRAEPRAHTVPTQPWPSRDAPKKRSKRGFTYPGTLWCGAGNMADHDDHLGDFPETDSCCRTHDHCPHVIHAFSSKYGYTNFKWHSICHCDCDIAMKQCLAKVNDTVSRVVGQAFFNVIGAPCFEFDYRDHCVERHWYGVCKRYERLPIAVPQPAVPYIFGGIPIIDVLTVAPPPAKTDAARVDAQAKRPEGATTSEPPAHRTTSLVTMVTAAEDFIKVLATVSTSQGAPADAARGAAPGEENKTKTKKKKKKKNRKNSGKRKKSQSQDKRKEKGRGRKLKSHKDTGVEDVLVASSSKVGVGDHFLTELKAGGPGHSDKNTFVEGGFDLAGHRGASNEVMKDEPAVEKDAAEVTSPPSPKERETRPSDLATASPGSARLAGPTSPATTTPRTTKALRSRKGERRRRKKTPQSESYCPPDNAVNMTRRQDSPGSSTTRLVDTSAHPCIAGVNPPAQTGLPRPQGRFESKSFLTTARTDVIMAEEEMVGKGQKRRRKLATAVPIVSVDHKAPTEESGKEMDSVGAPTASSIPQTKRPEVEVSHRPEMCGAKSAACLTPAPSQGVVKAKGQRLKGTGPQRRRGIVVPTPFIGNPLLEKPLEHAVPTSTSVLFDITATTTVVTRQCKQGQHSRRRGPQHVKTGIMLPVSAATKRLSGRKGDKTRKKTLLSVLCGRDASHTPSEATHGPGISTRIHVSTVAPKADEQEASLQISKDRFFATTGAPVVSAMQLSIQRVQKQFYFKKRRKELLFLRQQ